MHDVRCKHQGSACVRLWIALQVACPSPVNLSLSRLQQQSLPMHQQIGHNRASLPVVPLLQPKAGKTGNGSSDSGSNSPETHRHAPVEQTLPKAAAF